MVMIRGTVRSSAGPDGFTTICKNEQAEYRQTSNISRTLEGNTLVDHSDIVGATPVGAAPIISSFST